MRVKMRRFGRLRLWVDCASDDEPYWWCNDKDGIKQRYLFCIYQVAADETTNLTVIIAGCHKVVVGWL